MNETPDQAGADDVESSVPLSPSEELLADLSAWANENYASDDVYLNLVADVVAGVEPASKLRGFDSERWFPAAQSPLTSRVSWIIRLMSILRNVLIFAPVAVTWLAISQATAAFNLYVQQSQGVPVNFLQFWQDGYGFLSAEWTISNVALLDFAIIIVIALLSLAIGGGQTFGNRSVNSSIEQRMQARKALLLRLGHEFPEMSSSGGAGESSRNTHDVDAAVARIERSIQRLEPSLRSFTDALAAANSGLESAKDGFAALATSSSDSSKSVATESASAEAALRELGQQVARLTEATNAALVAAEGIHKSTSTATSRVEASAGELSAVSRETKDALVRLKKALARISDSVE